MNLFDINHYLYRNFITYDSLYALNRRAFYGNSNADYVNIFIDMRSLTRSLFNTNLEFSYKDQVTPIASSFINLAIHLREYYRTRHSVFTRIWLVWATNELAPVESLPGYNAHSSMSYNSNEVMKELIKKCNDTLKTVCPYLRDIYFVDGGHYDVSCIIQYLISNPDKSHMYNNVPNIIYTKDPFAFQLVANNSYTFLFIPKKGREYGYVKDISMLIGKSNIYERYCIVNGWKPKYDKIPSWRLDFFIPCMCLAHMKCKDMNNIGTFNRVSEIIHNNLAPEFPSLLTTGCDFFVDRLIDKLYTSGVQIQGPKLGNLDKGKEIAMCLDIRNMVISDNITSTLFEGIVDLYSPEDLRKINDKYFINYPIDILRL